MPDRTFSGTVFIPLALVAALLVAGGFAYDAALRGGLRARAFDELQAVAELQVGIVSRWIEERSGDVEGIAGSPALASALTGRPAFATDEIRSYLRAPVLRHAYERAILLDARGEVLLATDDDPVPAVALAIAQGSMGSGLPETSDLYTVGDAVHLYAAAPILSEDRIVGALLLVVDAARSLLPVVEHWPTTSRTAEVVLVETTDGGIRFVSRPRHLPEELGDVDIDVPPLSDQAAELRSSHLLTGLDYRGVPALGVARAVPGTPWIVLAKVDAAEALDEGPARAAIVAVIGALVVAAAAALGYALERSRRRALRVRYEAEQARARAEAEARRAAEDRQRVLDAVSDAVFGVSAEPPHRVTSWNAGAERLYGWSAAEAIGRPAAEVTPTDLTPERTEQVSRQLRTEGSTYQLWRQRRRDGTAIEVESQLALVRDDSGRPIAIAAVNRDLTERKAAEEALRTSEERLQQVLDATEAAEWEVDLASQTTRFGAGWQRLAGYERGEIDGLAALWRVIHPADAPAMRAGLEAHYRGEAPVFVAEHRLRTKSGEWKWLQCRAKVVSRDAAGRPVRLVGTSVDVTERRLAGEQLVVADRMASLGRLAAGVAHEINNPLTYVVANLGFAEGALDQLAAAAPASGLAAELQEAILEARSGALRVRDIVRDLKTFSRGDDGSHGEVDLRHVIESCVAMARSEIRHRARLALDLADIAPIGGNEAKLGQVVLNLLVNAAHAIPEGAVEENEIRVTLAGGPEEVAIEVQDTGCGIDAGDVRRIFDPFFTTKPVGQGTGLGLAISHRIVADLGGRIQVDTAPGRGTTFRVTLPRRAPVERPEPPAPRAPPPARRRVLVVDDEPSLATAVRRILSRHHDVTTFVDPLEALRHLGTDQRYDVLLCDVLMPGMTGLELHARLRTVAPRLAAATVLMTGGAFTPQAASALAASTLPRIEKPFSPEQLLAAISARAP